MGVYGADGERRRFEYRLGRVERGGREGVQREHRAGAIPAELLWEYSRRRSDVVMSFTLPQSIPTSPSFKEKSCLHPFRLRD